MRATSMRGIETGSAPAGDELSGARDMSMRSTERLSTCNRLARNASGDQSSATRRAVNQTPWPSLNSNFSTSKCRGNEPARPDSFT